MQLINLLPFTFHTFLYMYIPCCRDFYLTSSLFHIVPSLFHFLILPYFLVRSCHTRDELHLVQIMVVSQTQVWSSLTPAHQRLQTHHTTSHVQGLCSLSFMHVQHAHTCTSWSITCMFKMDGIRFAWFKSFFCCIGCVCVCVCVCLPVCLFSGVQ